MFSFHTERTDEDIDNLIQGIIKEKYNLIYNNESSCTKYERPKRVPDIPPMPVELFRNDPLQERRNLFFKGLIRGDVMYLQVVNSLPDSYKLLVLAKQKGMTKVDDLGLVMHLPKLFPEMKLLGSELNKGDFIKAALCSCSLHERKLYVTLDETLLTVLGDDVEVVKLGPITYHDLPYYLGRLENCLSYVGYIHRSEAFYNPGWSKQMCDVLGFKTNCIYSFLEEWQGKTYPEHEYASELKKKQRMNQSVKYYDQAVISYEEKKVEETFAFLNKALALNPINVQALTTRGTVHANEDSLRKAFIDTEAALNLDPNFEPAKKQLSKLLIALTKTHLEQHNYAKAQECLRYSANLDGDNLELAKPLLDLIPTKVRNLNRLTDDSSTFRLPIRSFAEDLGKESSSKDPHSSKESAKVHRSHKESSSKSKKKDKKHHRKRSRHHHSRRYGHRRDRSRSSSSRRSNTRSSRSASVRSSRSPSSSSETKSVKP